MKILTGVSQQKSASLALDEATSGWNEYSNSINFILLFHSTEQDSQELAAEVARRFPGIPSIGCSTAGEYLNGKHLNGSLVVTALASKEIQWAVTCVPNLSELTAEMAEKVAAQMASQFGVETDTLNPSEYFCLGFVDGLSMKEEVASALLADAFKGIPFLGGSSGDDLKFKKTFLLANGMFS